MHIPEELHYTQSHEWVKYTSDNTALMGLTWYAQDNLGSIVYVGLCDEGIQVQAGQSVVEIESVKSVAELYSPFDGVVVRVNNQLADNPELMNESPYDAWLCEITFTDKPSLLSPAEYDDICKRG